MNILILTTQTPHHAYFVQEIIKDFPHCCAVIETTGVQAPFEAGHESDRARDAYEIDMCLGGQDKRIADMVACTEVANINDEKTLDVIKEFAPDVVVDFGTRKVGEPIINLVRDRIVNLHGGDPEHYRGLDSHAWAMYHGDFGNLVTTLHRLNPELDKGEIIARKPVNVNKGMKFHEFRRANTQLCIEMVLDMLKTLDQTGEIVSTPQKAEGRYYSFMPTVLKNIAARKFEKYTDGL